MSPPGRKSIFTGGKLEPIKAPIEVLVVDHIETPKAN
jgi:hypothetical protein